MSTMYLPEVGAVNLRLYRINQAISEYDERLFLGRQPNGELTVFIRMPHGQAPFPVFGLAGVEKAEGDEYPYPEAVVRRLHQADTRRRGSEILDRMNKHNAKLEADRAAPLLDTRRQAYEMLEFHLRQMGMTEHTGPVFIPTSI